MCIALWHLPMTSTLIMWISLNIIGAFVEIWAKALGKTSFWTNITGQLSRPNHLRLLALISLPLFVLAIVSNLFFLSANEQVSYEFFKRILNNTDSYAVYLVLSLYCGANVSLDYNKVVKSSVDFAKMHGFTCRGKETASAASKKK